MQHLIEINNMSFSYIGANNNLFSVFSDFNLTVNEGERIGLIGANGAGKSTFLRILIGLLPDFDGLIKIDSERLDKRSVESIRKKVGYVFQDSDSQLFMTTVRDDIAFGPKNMGLTKEDVDRRVEEAILKTRISDIADRHVYKLSGGQKKLAAIATVLSMSPEIILMDEPSAGLDPANRENLSNVLKDLTNTQIIASHDLDFIYDTCERVVLLSKGEVVADGSCDEILRNEKLLLDNGLRLPLSFRFT